MSKELKRRTPAKSIRLHCLDCYGTSSAVANCEATTCSLYAYRLGRKSQSAPRRTKAIRTYCLGCVCGETGQVRKCTAGLSANGYHCPLWQFRMGVNPVVSAAARVSNPPGRKPPFTRAKSTIATLDVPEAKVGTARPVAAKKLR
ncbi:MAG: hypothetical protein WCJ35_03390 [Planctomycetota bacterium]